MKKGGKAALAQSKWSGEGSWPQSRAAMHGIAATIQWDLYNTLIGSKAAVLWASWSVEMLHERPHCDLCYVIL